MILLQNGLNFLCAYTAVAMLRIEVAKWGRLWWQQGIDEKIRDEEVWEQSKVVIPIIRTSVSRIKSLNNWFPHNRQKYSWNHSLLIKQYVAINLAKRELRAVHKVNLGSQIFNQAVLNFWKITFWIKDRLKRLQRKWWVTTKTWTKLLDTTRHTGLYSLMINKVFVF